MGSVDRLLANSAVEAALVEYRAATASLGDLEGSRVLAQDRRARAVVSLRDAGVSQPRLARVLGVSVALVQKLEKRGRAL